jgi:quinol monooxygenase YgiN
MIFFTEWEKFCDSGPFGGEPILDFSQGTHDAETILLRPAFCLNVELCIKADVREEFLKVIQNNQDGSVKEPLCFQYHYGESTTTPNSFYFHEQYGGAEDGKEGFDAHVVAPHFVVWEEFASTNPFTKPPVVSKYKTL